MTVRIKEVHGNQDQMFAQYENRFLPLARKPWCLYSYIGVFVLRSTIIQVFLLITFEVGTLQTLQGQITPKVVPTTIKCNVGVYFLGHFVLMYCEPPQYRSYLSSSTAHVLCQTCLFMFSMARSTENDSLCFI